MTGPACCAGERCRSSLPSADVTRTAVSHAASITCSSEVVFLHDDRHAARVLAHLEMQAAPYVVLPDAAALLALACAPAVVLCPLMLSAGGSAFDLARRLRAEASLRRTRLVAYALSVPEALACYAMQAGFDAVCDLSAPAPIAAAPFPEHLRGTCTQCGQAELCEQLASELDSLVRPADHRQYQGEDR